MTQLTSGNQSTGATGSEGTNVQSNSYKYTTATALMEALQEAGVSYIFANLGSDHPALIESWAQAKVQNRISPQIVICPHEMVALSAAHGYAQVSGKPQAVECGTQNLGGSIHNAATVFASTCVPRCSMTIRSSLT